MVTLEAGPAKLPAGEKELKESLNREEKHQLQKADAIVIEGGLQVLAPASRKTWLLWSHESGFRVKDTEKGLWNFHR